MPSEILVSAIMPTRGRRQMAARAVEMFRAQTWANKELVIVDDFDDPSFDRPPAGTVYEQLRHRLSIGAKRNIACSIARGQVILHWDSDDWYDPRRIEDQVKRLLASDAEITGYNEMAFQNVATGENFLYRGTKNYAVGVSLCYHRHYWKRHPFRDRSEGEDGDFQFGAKVLSVPANGMIVASIHAGNTSRRRLEHSAQWHRLETACA